MWPQTFKRYRRKGWLKGTLKKCPYCGVGLSAKNATVDHIIARSRGGSNKRANRILACRECNKAKRNKSVYEFITRDL